MTTRNNMTEYNEATVMSCVRDLIDSWYDFYNRRNYYLHKRLPEILQHPEKRTMREKINIEMIGNNRDIESLIIAYAPYTLKNKASLDGGYGIKKKENLPKPSQKPNKSIGSTFTTTNIIKEENLKNIYESISTKLADYRLGEIPRITPKNVNEWIDQFSFDNVNEKEMLLEGINCLVSNYYFRKSQVTQGLTNFLKEYVFTQNNLTKGLDISFLSHQRFGSSQDDMVQLTREICRDSFNYELHLDKEADLIVYLDDCAYTGRRVKGELKEKMNSLQVNKNTHFLFYFFAMHKQTLLYLKKEISEFMDSIGGDSSMFKIDQSKILHNSRDKYGKLDVLVPRKELLDDGCNAKIKEWINYLHNLRKENGNNETAIYWPNDYPPNEDVFTDLHLRKFTERKLIETGAELLLKINPDPNKKGEKSIRPLGFDYPLTLGFGAMYLSYRNIANNCPIAFWLDGDKCGIKWKPLLPRKSSQSDAWWG